MAKELFEVEVVVLHETEKALLVCLVDDFDEDRRKIAEDAKVWLPKSQLDAETTVAQRGDRGSAVIPLWLAEKKGWA